MYIVIIKRILFSWFKLNTLIIDWLMHRHTEAINDKYKRNPIQTAHMDVRVARMCILLSQSNRIYFYFLGDKPRIWTGRRLQSNQTVIVSRNITITWRASAYTPVQSCSQSNKPNTEKDCNKIATILRFLEDSFRMSFGKSNDSNKPNDFIN